MLGATVRHNFGFGETDQLEVFSGNDLYSTVLEHRNGVRLHRDRLSSFHEFLSENFFDKKPVELIPLVESADSSRRLAISIGGQEDRKLHDVGDGIQAIIILMYRLFTANPGSWIFIEEPELNLHPGLQRIFLHALAHNKAIREKDLRIFMTTHSNHIIGMLLPETEEAVVFSFQEAPQEGHFLVRPVLDRDHNPMTLLGVTNASVFLANCAIWVEGITDRKYLRAYLKAYQTSTEFQDAVREGTKRLMREDIHYAFLEYAGSNLAHYLFNQIGDELLLETTEDQHRDVPDEIHALALCNRIFLLADRDEGKEEKHKRLREAMEGTEGNLQYQVTHGIEIENTIPETVLQLALQKLVQKGDPAAISAIKVYETDYIDRPLGDYLCKLFGEACPDKFVAQGGSLASYYKNKLANIVSDLIPEVVQWKDLSSPAQRLTQDLYTFIARHNP